MTLDDLIQDLTELRDEIGGDAPARIAVQPSWPLRHKIVSVKRHEGLAWLVAAEGAPYDERAYADKRLWEEGLDLDEIACEGCDLVAPTTDDDELADAGWQAMIGEWACPACLKLDDDMVDLLDDLVEAGEIGGAQ